MVLVILLHKVALTFESGEEILMCDQSNKAAEPYFHVVLFIMLYKVALSFEFAVEIFKCYRLNESY